MCLETIHESNLSLAWAKAFLKVLNSGQSQVSPLIVKISDFPNQTIPEDPEIRRSLDDSLVRMQLQSVNRVANTIFPHSLWNPDLARGVLFDRYKRIWPRIKIDRLNRYGVYFHRLIAFEDGESEVNQLEHIITTWNSHNHRHSALQAALFDPRKDHSRSRLRGFPCLQQVAFSPIGANGRGGLAVLGFYATQYIFEKAYGNYVGLFRLGHFMAKEMNLRLTEMTCIASYAKSGNTPQTALHDLRADLETKLGLP